MQKGVPPVRVKILIAALAMFLGACAGSGLGTDTLNATKATLDFYGDVVQPGIIAFGRTPTCPQPTPVICKNPETWATIQATDARVTASIVAARAALNGSVPNAGQAAAAVREINGSIPIVTNAGVRLPQ